MANDSWLMGALAAQDAYRRGDDPPWPPPPQPGAVFNSPWERGVAIASDYAGRETPPASATEEPPEMGSLLGMGRAGETIKNAASEGASQLGAGIVSGYRGALETNVSPIDTLLGGDPEANDLRIGMLKDIEARTPEPTTQIGKFAKAIGTPLGNPMNYWGVGPAAGAAWAAASGVTGEIGAQAFPQAPNVARAVFGATPMALERVPAAVRAMPEGRIGVFGGRFTQPQRLNAEAMEQMGRTPQQIWEQVGLARGADGKWRNEISDSNSRMRANAPSELDVPRPLSEHFIHPEAFKIYPELAKIPTRAASPEFMQELGGLHGGYHPQMGFFYNPNGFIDSAGNFVSPRQIILHEMNHAIQKMSGFASGGTPAGMTRKAWLDYWRQAGEVDSRNVETRMDFTRKQGQKISPFETQDVPTDQQLVQFYPKKSRGKMGSLAAMSDDPLLFEEPPSAPPFYSAAGAAVVGAKQAQAPGPQWLATLRNTPGVKPEEIQRLGLENYLQQQSGPVGRQQLADFIAANTPQVETLRKGYQSAHSPRFDNPNYQLPGGENYRETLLTLPSGQIGGDYRSSHWPDDPNPLAHYRTTERTIDGKKTLMLEEVQSDWHQTGRKEGYHGDPRLPPEQLSALEQERTNLSNELDRLDQLSFTVSGEQRANVMRQLDAKLARLGEIDPILTRNDPTAGVPDAPFRTVWPELVLKRAIRDAAERGHEQLAWTPGSVQVERYPGSETDLTGPMEVFYDKMLSAAANKIGKKYGAQTGQAAMGEHTVHTLPVTPSLRDTALQKGFPLFQLGAGAGGMGMLAAQDRYDAL